ncbi:MAG: hypothetical protein BWK79_01755 [Beggiatoa sp. IS2]|nr:MAG: hypothetical protein BWK79_01755 [Beggiatoa sp. IS2]
MFKQDHARQDIFEALKLLAKRDSILICFCPLNAIIKAAGYSRNKVKECLGELEEIGKIRTLQIFNLTIYIILGE